MSFPDPINTTVYDDTVQATTHTITYVAAPTAGNLLLLVLSSESSPNWQIPGYSQIDTASSGRYQIWARKADGSEGASFDATRGDSRRLAALVHEFSQWFGDIATGIATGIDGFGVDPPAVTAPWGSDQTLWLAGFHSQRSDNTLTPPADYANKSSARNGTSSSADTFTVATARRELEAETEDPGPWTAEGEFSANFASTIAIRPQEGATPGIRRTLRNTDTGDVAANLTDVTAVVRTAPDTEATLHKTATATTDGDGTIAIIDATWPVTNETGEEIGDTDENGDMVFTFNFDDVQPSSVTLSGPTETIVDDGEGSLHLDGDDTAGRGTIDYEAGTGNITGSADNEAAFTAAYDRLRDEVWWDVVSQDGETVGSGYISVVANAGTTESTMRGEA